MKIEVLVKPNSRQERVEKLISGEFKVAVNAPAQEGRANAAVIELLADYFKVPKSAVTILRGHLGKKKLLEIDESKRKRV